MLRVSQFRWTSSGQPAALLSGPKSRLPRQTHPQISGVLPQRRAETLGLVFGVARFFAVTWMSPIRQQVLLAKVPPSTRPTRSRGWEGFAIQPTCFIWLAKNATPLPCRQLRSFTWSPNVKRITIVRLVPLVESTREVLRDSPSVVPMRGPQDLLVGYRFARHERSTLPLIDYATRYHGVASPAVDSRPAATRGGRAACLPRSRTCPV